MAQNKETLESMEHLKNLSWLVGYQIGRMSQIEYYDQYYNYKEKFIDELLPILEVCRMLNLSRSGVYTLIKKKHLHAIKIKREWRVKVSDVDIYIGRFIRW